MCRFLINKVLVSGGYPETIISFESRSDYMQALEKASTKQNIIPFTSILVKIKI